MTRSIGYQGRMREDEELTDQWERCALGRAITHEEHLRIARILVKRHGRHEAPRRLVDGTRANCAAIDATDRFDEHLTRRWGDQIANAIEDGDGEGFEDFIALHPVLARSDLLGPPAWRTR